MHQKSKQIGFFSKPRKHFFFIQSMTNSSSYKLNSDENKQVKKRISESRKGVKYAIKCAISFDNDEDFRDAIFAYSEFRLWFLIRKKKKFVLKEKIHIYQLKSLYISESGGLEIRFSYHLVTITSSGISEITHLILPIIYSSTKFLESQVAEISADNRDQYPLFIPNISISQQIQICYDAYCSLFGKTYLHQIAMFFHRMINTESVILDLSYLPYQLLYLQADTNCFFQPLFKAATQFKYFIGITCYNAKLPDILIEIASILKTTNTISFLSLSGIGMVHGGKELGEAIKENKDLNLISIDLSNNKISDMHLFTEALQYLTKPLYYLNLSNCCLSEIAIRNLCRSLMLNPNLRTLKVFEITGSSMGQHLGIFSNFFHESCNSLERVHLGAVTTGLDPFTIQLNTKQRYFPILESLSIAGSNLDDTSISNLTLFVGNSKDLKELDLSSTSISPTQLSKIIGAINENQEIKIFSLHLNNLGLKDGKIKTVFSSLSDKSNLMKWKALSLENNGLSCQDFIILIQILGTLPNLTTLNIGMNFDDKTKDIEQYLPNLLTLPRLEKLSLRGSKEKYLTVRIISAFVTALIKSNKTLRLNLRDNKLGDQGYSLLKDAIDAHKLIELQIDGNIPTTLCRLEEIINSASKDHMIKLFDFPSRDFKRLYNSFSKNDKTANLQKIEKERCTLLRAIQERLINSGIHSRWTLNGVNAIEEAVDNQTKKLHDYLVRRSTTDHSFSCVQHFGRSMPFLEDNVNPETLGNIRTIKEPATVNVYQQYQVTLDFLQEVVPPDRSLYYHYLENKQSVNCDNVYSTLSDIDYITTRKTKFSTKTVSFDDDRKFEVDFSRVESMPNSTATILQNSSISISPGSYSSAQESSDSQSNSQDD